MQAYRAAALRRPPPPRGQTSPSIHDLKIPKMSGLPVGMRLGHTYEENVTLPEGDPGKSPCVEPYSHSHHPSRIYSSPSTQRSILVDAIRNESILETTVLDCDTAIEHGGILNIPVVVDEANAMGMRSILRIHMVEGQSEDKPRWLLQYAQFVLLDFFPGATVPPV
jgi:hypothetical protein